MLSNSFNSILKMHFLYIKKAHKMVTVCAIFGNKISQRSVSQVLQYLNTSKMALRSNLKLTQDGAENTGNGDSLGPGEVFLPSFLPDFCFSPSVMSKQS